MTAVLTRNFDPSTLTSTMIGESNKEYIKFSEQKVTIGKNNKKKIQPAMMVRKDEINSLAMKQSHLNSFNFGQPSGTNFPNSTFFLNSMVQTFPSLELPAIIFT